MKLFDFILFYVGLFSLKQTLSFLEDKFLFIETHNIRTEERKKKRFWEKRREVFLRVDSEGRRGFCEISL
jgi:hypothetical protein